MNPSSQSTSKITRIVQSMAFSFESKLQSSMLERLLVGNDHAICATLARDVAKAAKSRALPRS
jgi:hypothetical protein